MTAALRRNDSLTQVDTMALELPFRHVSFQPKGGQTVLKGKWQMAPAAYVAWRMRVIWGTLSQDLSLVIAGAIK